MQRKATSQVLIVVVGLLCMVPMTAYADTYDHSLSPPIIVEPLYGCADLVAYSGVVRDSVVVIYVNGYPETKGPGNLGWGSVQLDTPLAINDLVTARQWVGSNYSDLSRDEARVVDVPPPSNAPPHFTLDTPAFAGTLYECQQTVSLDGLLNGATAMLLNYGIAQWEVATPYNHATFLVPELEEGQLYSAMQTFCPDSPWYSGGTIDSEVQPAPSSLPTPVIREPFFEHHDYAWVDNLFPGAGFEIFATDGTTQMLVGAGISSRESGNFKIDPPLNSEYSYYVVQRLCDLESAIDPGTFITPTAEIPALSVLGPICDGEFYVRVCDVIPGSTVKVYANYSSPSDPPIAQASGSGCLTMALGGMMAFSTGDRVTARQNIANGTASGPSNEVIVSADGVPVYDPDYWSSEQYINVTNCYNYACDMPQDGLAEPGKAGGYLLPPVNDLTCSILEEAVLADGLVSASFDVPCEGCSHKVALAVSPFLESVKGLLVDFHLYRENPDGSWSHKIRQERPTKNDASGVLITNPESADRDYSREGNIQDYWDFCGFYCVDKRTVNIEGPDS